MPKALGLLHEVGMAEGVGAACAAGVGDVREAAAGAATALGRGIGNRDNRPRSLTLGGCCLGWRQFEAAVKHRERVR